MRLWVCLQVPFPFPHSSMSSRGIFGLMWTDTGKISKSQPSYKDGFVSGWQKKPQCRAEGKPTGWLLWEYQLYCSFVKSHDTALLWSGQGKKGLRRFKSQSSISPGRLEPGHHGFPGGMEWRVHVKGSPGWF